MSNPILVNTRRGDVIEKSQLGYTVESHQRDSQLNQAQRYLNDSDNANKFEEILTIEANSLVE